MRDSFGEGFVILIHLPFFIAGALKIAYDLLLYRAFIAVRPPEETGQP